METVMNGGATQGLSACAERWALALTGSEGEASFGPWLAGELRQETAFRHAEIWTIEVEPGDGRHCVAMLLRGNGRATVVLTGHYDTVTTRDYGELEDLATRPGLLTPALGKIIATADTPAARRARADFASGEFLAGRGLLDMKAGLAAGLPFARNSPEPSIQEGISSSSLCPTKKQLGRRAQGRAGSAFHHRRTRSRYCGRDQSRCDR
ncbi:MULTISPECIES: hypothetical protein [unclassified Mesorhizobium]|uniref:hypothetical protein n=1 Tax=unclassified Mesorhizobium TaxID=325217 RepID=UPI000F751E58|nr:MULTISPECIES: hypothetical protein [unclassified Mesorhizobium]AZO56388.1 hypothetical protein EJ077_25530 [Mesorhizobium sp. M8A.F.Ca.ET.057.01.1.1]RWE48726.1 MAG: hypothetical protein EOS80_04240 [Mesorhizobium sp.]